MNNRNPPFQQPQHPRQFHHSGSITFCQHQQNIKPANPANSALQLSPNKGFTLIELSIVLVIIGLIVGGVLVGQDLIYTANIRKVISEHENFVTAINTFRLKYNCLPGDCTNATNFFTGANNGNGDRVIGLRSSGAGGAHYGFNTIPGQLPSWRENYAAWDHLAQANLISGSYTGVSIGNIYTGGSPGQNIPKSNFEDAAWCFGQSNNNWRFAMNYDNTLTIASTNDGTASNYCSVAIWTPDEALLIDEKYDDGMPAKGKITAFSSRYCTTSNLDPTNLEATYRVTDKTDRCWLNFRNSF